MLNLLAQDLAIPNIKEQLVKLLNILETNILLLQHTKQKKDYNL